MNEILESLGFDISQYAEIARVHFLIVFVDKVVRDNEDLPKINQELKQMTDAFEIPEVVINDVATISKIRELLNKYHLEKVENLSAEYAPLMVCDYKKFSELVKDMNPLMHSVLLFHILTDFKLDDFLSDSYMSVFEKHQELYAKKMRLLPEKLKALGLSIFSLKMLPALTRRDPNVEEVKKIYERKFVGRESLLEAILIAKKADVYSTKTQHQLADAMEKRIAAYEKRHGLLYLSEKNKQKMKRRIPLQNQRRILDAAVVLLIIRTQNTVQNAEKRSGRFNSAGCKIELLQM